LKQVTYLVEKFKDFNFKKAYKREKNRRMGTRLLALHHLCQGRMISEVCDLVLASEVSIRKWAKAFEAGGMNALLEEAGRGRQKKLARNQEKKFIKEIKQLQNERQGGRVIGKDIQKLLIEKFKIKYCLNSVYVLLDRLGFSWISCRSKHPKNSQDAIDSFKKDFPDIVTKVQEKVDNKKIEVWWQDEMRVGQQGSLSRMWAETGTRPRAIRQQQYLSTYIFGAACPDKDKSCALILPRVDTDMMQLHLYEISKQIDEDYHAIILMDRASCHTTEKLILPPNLNIVPLPPYSPELNPMEQLWQQLRKLKLSNACYQNYDGIVDACVEAWNMFVSEEDNVKKLCSRDWALIES
jgi:transposase